MSEKLDEHPDGYTEKCGGCGNFIDPDWCHCGDRISTHNIGSGHAGVPMGCTCGYHKPNKK